MPFTLVINAGGQSRRMGQHKALLSIPPRQIPLLHHLIQRLQSLAPRIIIIANDPEIIEQAGTAANTIAANMSAPNTNAPNITVFGDRYLDSGPLGGIASGLSRCEDWAMVAACDMPLINPDLFRFMQRLADEPTDLQQTGLTSAPWDAIVPIVNGFAEPLHALYHQRCLAHIERRLANGERRANSFYPDVNVRFVNEDELRKIDPQLRSFININTPEEWQKLLTLFENEGEILQF